MRWFLMIVGVLLVIFIGLVLLLNQADPHRHIERQAEQRLGLAVDLDEDATLLLFPRLGFYFARAEIANPEEFSDGPMATLDGVRVTLSLAALLRGQLVVNHLHVEDGKLDLLRHQDATGNWESLQLQPAETEDPPIQLSLGGARKITADQLRISYQEAETEASYQVLLTELQLDDLEAGNRGRLETGWQLRDDNGLDLSGTIDSRLRPREDGWGLALGIEQFSVAGSLRGNTIDASGEGRLLIDLGKPGLQLRDAHLTDDHSRLDLSGTLLLRDGRPHAVANFDLTASDLCQTIERISDTTLEMEDEAALRDLALEGRLQLNFGELNLDRYTPLELDPDMVRAIIELLANAARQRDVSGYLEFERLQTLGLDFQRFRMDLQGDRQSLSFSPITAAAWDGEVDGAVSIDLQAEPLAHDFRFSALQINPAIISSALFDSDSLTGKLDLDLTGRFQGLDWAMIRDSPDAEGSVFLSAAEIRGFSLKRKVEDSVPSSLGGTSRDVFADDATTEISQLEGELVVRDGRLENTSASARSRHFEAEGEGMLELSELILDYRLRVKMVESFETESERLLSLLQDIDLPIRVYGRPRNRRQSSGSRQRGYRRARRRG